MCSSAPMLLNTLTTNAAFESNCMRLLCLLRQKGVVLTQESSSARFETFLILRRCDSCVARILVETRHESLHWMYSSQRSIYLFFFFLSLSFVLKKQSRSVWCGWKKKKRWFDGVEAASFCLHVLDFYKPEQCRNIRNHSRVITWDKYDLIHCCVVLIRSVIG